MTVFARNIGVTISCLLCVLGIALSESHGAEISNLRVLTLNVWNSEGTKAGRDKIAEIIRASGADLVGLQEMGNSEGIQVAEALGFHYLQQSASDTQVISRFPILERTNRRWGAEIEITPGHTLWLFNAHLSAYPYQPYDLRDRVLSSNETDVIAAANAARGNQVTSLLRDVRESGALESGTPVFMTGDFNEPSHVDWTQAAADFTDRPYDLKVDYPASTRITELGFTDSFRHVRPLQTASGEFDFAHTWTPGYPPPSVTRDEVHDRIDLIYHRDGSHVTAIPTDALNIGPDLDRDADWTMTDISVSGYNSDHRAVVTSYDIRGFHGSELTFSKLGVNGDPIDGAYGDKLITSPDVLVDYAANNGQWKFWEEGHWDRGGVAFLDSDNGQMATGNSRFDLVLTAADLIQVQLDSFDIIDWIAPDTLGQTVTWQLLREDQVLFDGVAEVPDDGTVTVLTNMAKPYSGSLTLRLSPTAGFNQRLAIDNIAFDQFLLGDLNRNGSLQGSDIDDLSGQIRASSTDATYDLNADGVVDEDDRTYWVESLAKTYFGDSNLDGEFNTTDFTAVFQAGQYDDDLVGNSGWSNGDWNGDSEFDSRDFVKAFQSLGFEQGPRVAVVPEPNPSMIVFVVSGFCCLSRFQALRDNRAQRSDGRNPRLPASELVVMHVQA